MKALEQMNKVELRAACKEHGVKNYGKMDNAGMRAAILAATTPVVEATQADVFAAMEAAEVQQAGALFEAEEIAEVETVILTEDDKELVERYGHANCPHCGINLFNGVGFNGDVVNGTKIKHEQFEFECLGCGEEFGAPIKKQRTSKASANYQPFVAREERNGAKRPAKPGLCLSVWLALDDIYKMGEGRIPTIKDVRELATQNDWNLTNASVEFYQWRKFNYLNGSK